MYLQLCTSVVEYGGRSAKSNFSPTPPHSFRFSRPPLPLRSFAALFAKGTLRTRQRGLHQRHGERQGRAERRGCGGGGRAGAEAAGHPSRRLVQHEFQAHQQRHAEGARQSSGCCVARALIWKDMQGGTLLVVWSIDGGD